MHRQIFRSACKLVNKIVQKAKSTFYNTKMRTDPSSLLAELTDDLLPSFTLAINESLLTGSFPSVLKSAVVKPLLKKKKKKKSLDTENFKNYKRVSNLPFLSKVTQQIALLQLSQCLESNNLLYSLQFAYCPDHNTETVLLNIVSDLLAAPDINHISLLSLPIRRF